MFTENGLQVDIAEVQQIVAKADVFTVAFRLFPERLLIDTRYDADDPEGASGMPMVAIVDPVASVEERYFWLGQHRPSLGMPESFQFFFWPHSIRYLEETGVWAAIRARVESAGFAGAHETSDAAVRDLVARERAAHIDAITGEQYHTLWSVVRD